CCSKIPNMSRELKVSDASSSSATDVERGPAQFLRVVLAIGGLKCGCCESGISKAFRNIPAIKNHQVNIVLARVEFDLDIGLLSIDEAVSQLSRITGYTFEKQEEPEGQILEVLVNNPRHILEGGKPYGVLLIDPSSLFQHTVRIHYDAKLIGARDVFEYYQQLIPGQDLQLAHPRDHPSLVIGAHQTKKACIMFAVSLLFTIPVLVLAWAFDQTNLTYAHASLALATVVQLIATREFVPGALKTLIYSQSFEMDFLVALSTTTAYVFSVVLYVYQVKGRPLSLETRSFFETSTLLVTLILLGRVVNEFARLRAAKAVSFRSLQAEQALLIISGHNLPREFRTIDARLLQYGDSFKIPPHTRIVTDGDVIYGGSEVDESVMTGESLPVAKGLGHKVYAGTVNGSGELIVTLTALPHENSISKIAAMVESAELSKPKVQALADQIAGWFVPAIMAIGTIVLLTWVLVERYGQRQASWQQAVITAITYAIATLIVSCPCAIGLAVPMVVLIAGGVSARYGIIFRDSQKLEIARNATDIVFDKTGTLTTGQLTVVEAVFHIALENEVKGLIMGLLADSKHPVATATYKWLEENRQNRAKEGIRINPAEIVAINSVPGGGVEGVCTKTKVLVRAGNPAWLSVKVLDSPHTILCVTVAGGLVATFRLQDRPRFAAGGVVKLLAERGITVHMISGDSAGAVNEIAHTLSISKQQTHSRLKPGDKQKYIQSLQENGRVVLFVGDGTNDSVALKQADVGVHMNHGSDVAKSASDVVLMTTRLLDIPILLDISQAAFRRIMFNFGWSAVYNLVAILMAAGAFVKFRIPPAYAGLGELVSVLPVVFIAFQLRW
ncbi:E1-E2 ATPase-domain-containing protein, partial [Clohesyomyces aquaticus]